MQTLKLGTQQANNIKKKTQRNKDTHFFLFIQLFHRTKPTWLVQIKDRLTK